MFTLYLIKTIYKHLWFHSTRRKRCYLAMNQIFSCKEVLAIVFISKQTIFWTIQEVTSILLECKGSNDLQTGQARKSLLFFFAGPAKGWPTNFIKRGEKINSQLRSLLHRHEGCRGRSRPGLRSKSSLFFSGPAKGWLTNFIKRGKKINSQLRSLLYRHEGCRG